MNRIAAALSLTVWCAAWAGAATATRFAWVEDAATAVRCDAGAVDVVCTWRAVVIQAFVLDRLGLAAVVLALCAAGLAVWRTQINRPGLALGGQHTQLALGDHHTQLALGVHRAQRTALLGALAMGSAGLCLYSAQWAAPALLLAAATWVGEDTDQIAALAARASNTPA